VGGPVARAYYNNDGTPTGYGKYYAPELSFPGDGRQWRGVGETAFSDGQPNFRYSRDSNAAITVPERTVSIRQLRDSFLTSPVHYADIVQHIRLYAEVSCENCPLSPP